MPENLLAAAALGRIHELIYQLTVEQIMTRRVITVTPADTMRVVKDLLRAHHFSGTPVVENGQLVGITSTEDVIRCLEQGAIDLPVAEGMTRQVVTVRAEETVAEVIRKFARYGFGRLPVVDAAGGLVGIVTRGDITGRLLFNLGRARPEEVVPLEGAMPLGDLVSDATRLMLSYYVKAGDMRRAGEASTRLKRALNSLRLPPDAIRRAAVAAYEAEMNLAIHSVGGWLSVEVTPRRIAITASDLGPGISSVEQAMQPGFSTAPDWIRELGFGAGMGLFNMKRFADEFSIDSEPGRGTVVWAAVNLEVRP